MLGKLNLKTKTGLAAALAFAALSGPAPAQLPDPDPSCMQFLRTSYCPTYWRAQNFPSQEACVQAYTDDCRFGWVFYYSTVPLKGRLER